MITVRAIREGYHTFFRHVGDVFEIEGDLNEAGAVQHFSKKWMVRVLDAPAAAKGVS
jgi:hypothetical protein